MFGGAAGKLIVWGGELSGKLTCRLVLLRENRLTLKSRIWCIIYFPFFLRPSLGLRQWLGSYLIFFSCLLPAWYSTPYCFLVPKVYLLPSLYFRQLWSRQLTSQVSGIPFLAHSTATGVLSAFADLRVGLTTFTYMFIRLPHCSDLQIIFPSLYVISVDCPRASRTCVSIAFRAVWGQLICFSKRPITYRYPHLGMIRWFVS